jgi:hypothetical protein
VVAVCVVGEKVRKVLVRVHEVGGECMEVEGMKFWSSEGSVGGVENAGNRWGHGCGWMSCDRSVILRIMACS